MEVKSFRSWNLNADDFQKSLAFYRDLLGAKVTSQHQVAGVDVVRLNLGGVTIGVFDASGGERPGVPHHTIGVDGPDDPEELKREIEAKGYVVDHIRSHADRGGSGYSLYVDDPSGNHIEISKSD